MENIGFLIFCLVALVVAIALVKKFVGCIIRSAIFLIVIALVALAYFYYFAP